MNDFDPANLDLLQARAAARSAEAETEALSGFDAVLQRAGAHRQTEWDHARGKLICARIEEARAQLRIWL